MEEFLRPAKLPDHDGVKFFRPICVAQMLGDRVYTYVKFCGCCRKRMGSLGEVKEFCPRCGAGVAHYIFAMGVVTWRSDDWRDRLPDQLPNFSTGEHAGLFSGSGTGERKLLSGDTVNGQESHGNI